MSALIIAIVAVVAVLVLGYSARRSPIGFDERIAQGAFGHATEIAWRLTNLGYARDIVLVYVLAFVVLRFERPRDLVPLAFLALAQVASQLVSTGFKGVFKRVRPQRWLRRQELSAGYPSGHATTATVTYGGIAFAALAPLDGAIAIGIRETVAAIAIAIALGIMWSRLALGAHYLSDVIGGAILGSAALAALVALHLQVATPFP